VKLVGRRGGECKRIGGFVQISPLLKGTVFDLGGLRRVWAGFCVEL